MIDKKVLQLTRIGKYQRLMGECLRVLLIGLGLFVYMFPSFVSCVRTSLMGLKKSKTLGLFKAVTHCERTISCGFHTQNRYM